MRIKERISDFFKKSQETRTGIPWQTVSVEEQVEAIIEASTRKPQILYKHSSSCAVSYFALKNLESLGSDKFDEADFYMVDVIKQRSISNFIEDKLGIRHESPQLFVLENGEVSWSGSHQEVQSTVLVERL